MLVKRQGWSELPSIERRNRRQPYFDLNFSSASASPFLSQRQQNFIAQQKERNIKTTRSDRDEERKELSSLNPLRQKMRPLVDSSVHTNMHVKLKNVDCFQSFFGTG
jgi:hypothetical protein